MKDLKENHQNKMLKFSSKICEEIYVEGLRDLKVSRKIKLFHTFDLTIFQEGKNLLTISTENNFLKSKYLLLHNETGIEIIIEKETNILFDNERFELKIDRFYLFKKRFAEVWINNKVIGQVFFEKRGLINHILNFIPDPKVEINDETAFKITILILLNMVLLDGSE